jgi:phage-related baseplate assembly protein
MTRFLAPDLSALPPPPAIEVLDYEATVTARKADLSARLRIAGQDETADLLVLETEPLTISVESEASFEITQRGRINDAVKAVLVATSTGADLDHVCATNYGVARLTLVEADPDADPPVLEVREDDDTFRARALLSMEARSGAGPEGAYLYFALQASPDVLDAQVYSEDDGAEYADGSPVLAPEVLVVVVSRVGDGTTSPELLSAVAAALAPEDRRPIGDRVTVEGAAITRYSIEAVLKHGPGPSEPIVAAALARVQAYVAQRRFVGRKVQRLGIGGALKVTDVEELELVIRDGAGGVVTAEAIDPGSKGSAYCTGIALTAQVLSDTWRG